MGKFIQDVKGSRFVMVKIRIKYGRGVLQPFMKAVRKPQADQCIGIVFKTLGFQPVLCCLLRIFLKSCFSYGAGNRCPVMELVEQDVETVFRVELIAQIEQKALPVIPAVLPETIGLQVVVRKG